MAVSCGKPQLNVGINEETFYTLEGPQGVFVSHLFSSDTSSMSMAAWQQISEGQTCMDASGIASFKQELEKLCSEAPCTQNILNVIKNLNKIQRKM